MRFVFVLVVGLMPAFSARAEFESNTTTYRAHAHGAESGIVLAKGRASATAGRTAYPVAARGTTGAFKLFPAEIKNAPSSASGSEISMSAATLSGGEFKSDVTVQGTNGQPWMGYLIDADSCNGGTLDWSAGPACGSGDCLSTDSQSNSYDYQASGTIQYFYSWAGTLNWVRTEDRVTHEGATYYVRCP